MTVPKNPAEAFVARIARRSFLALWSYANPRRKSGKELCDVLAVCDPDVVIFSVRNVSVSKTRDLGVRWERWQRKAVDESVKQIYGAERELRREGRVIRSDGPAGLVLPDRVRLRVHRIAVALGDRGQVPMLAGDLGKGFVHVLSDDSVEAVLRELDTVSDLTAYLAAKDQLFRRRVRVTLNGSEKDLLAFYLRQGREFPTGHDLLLVDEGIWDGFASSPEYKSKKEADRDSYAWDGLVDLLCEDLLSRAPEFGPDLDQAEVAIRTMARENRFARRGLGRSLKEFLGLAQQKKTRSRFGSSPSGVVYVFLATPHGYPRDARMAELAGRCFVARGLRPTCTTVVGVATEQENARKGSSMDLAHLYVSEWTPKHQLQSERLQRELGYFSRCQTRLVREEEYPASA